MSPQLVLNEGKAAPRRRLKAADERVGDEVVANPNSALIWTYRSNDRDGDGKLGFEEVMHRGIGAPAIENNLLFVADYSGWLQGGNPVWDPSLLAGLTVRTWEVQLFNLAHEYAASQGDAFLDHGLGYYTLAHLVARLTRQGAWGMVPPWLAQGLIDELDIQAYEQAWVGQDFQLVERAGWYREGWSGFVPQGASPPPPVVGPPRDLAVTVSRTGDSWQHRDFSTERHWEHLVADRKSEAPASFAFMAVNESFLPRDRAAARCALHLLLEGALTSGRPGLLEQLDRIPSTPPSGMPDADPITVVVARALGGVPAVDELESLGAGDLAARLERPELADQLAHLGALEVLRIADHREQAEWLYGQTMDVMDGVTRQAIWTLILELEYYQQLLEWELIGEALDAGLAEALGRSKRYPSRDRDKDKVLTAFWSGLGHDD